MTRVVSIVSLLFAVGFTVVAAREHLARGGPMLARTIASNSSTSPRDAEATMLLYAYAARTLPRGATVTVFKPRSRGEDFLTDRIAHGQLPHHKVVPVWMASTPSDYVITLGAPLEDPRYAVLYTTRVGAIWKRMS